MQGLRAAGGEAGEGGGGERGERERESLFFSARNKTPRGIRFLLFYVRFQFPRIPFVIHVIDNFVNKRPSIAVPSMPPASAALQLVQRLERVKRLNVLMDYFVIALAVTTEIAIPVPPVPRPIR